MPLPPLKPEQLVKPDRFEFRIALIFGAIFLPLGVHLPYFPLWLEAQGFRAEEIGTILAAPMFLRVITTPMITALRDRARDRANVLVAITAISFLLSFGYFLPPTYGLVLAVSVVLAVFWTPQSPLADSLALSGVRRFGSSYSKMRIWGSLTFLAGSFIGGLILALAGTQAVPVMITAGLAGVLAAVVAAPRLGTPRKASPLSVTEFHTAPKLFSRYFLLFVAGVGIINASHGFLFAFGSIHWKDMGIGDGTIGILWAWSIVAEVLVFLFFDRLFGRISATSVLMIAGAAAVLRWSAYPLIEEASGLGMASLFAAQSLHALSTGLLLIGVQKMIGETAPEERTGAAQGVAFFANGFSMAAVTLASGPLYAALGTDGFYVMAAAAAVGLGLIVAAAFSPRGPGQADTPEIPHM